MENTEIKLTKEELDIIYAKRKEQKERYEAIKEKETARVLNLRSSEHKKSDRLYNAALEFYNDGFNDHPDWSFTETSHIKDYHINIEGRVVESFTAEFKTALITHKNPKYKVQVRDHIVYGSGFMARGNNRGMKMFLIGVGYDLENRPMKSVKNVIKKVEESIALAQEKIEEVKAKKNAIEGFMNKQKELFPEAEITSDKEWVYSNKFRKGEAREEDRVYVKFQNGVTVTFRVWSDSSYSRVKVTYPTVKKENEIEFLNQLSKLNF